MKLYLDNYVSYNDFVLFYGNPSETQLSQLTQHLLESYHLGGDTVIDSIGDGFGVDWLQALIEYNSRREEYELCSIMKEILDKYIENYGNKQTEKSIIQDL